MLDETSPLTVEEMMEFIRTLERFKSENARLSTDNEALRAEISRLKAQHSSGSHRTSKRKKTPNHPRRRLGSRNDKTPGNQGL